MLQMRNFHKYFGYFIIISVQVTVCTGIARKVAIASSPNEGREIGLIMANLLIFFTFTIAGEVLRHKYLSQETPWK